MFLDKRKMTEETQSIPAPSSEPPAPINMAHILQEMRSMVATAVAEALKDQSAEKLQESPRNYDESEVEDESDNLNEVTEEMMQADDRSVKENKEQLILEKLDGLGDDNKVDVKDDDDVLQALTQAMETEEYGDDRSEKIAGVCNLLLTTGLSDQKIQDRMEKYKTPQNCKVVAVPKVNKVIWSLLSIQGKAIDAAAQKAQNKVSKAMVALMEAMDEINDALETMPGLKSPFAKMTDCLTMLSSIHRDASFRRREKSKQSLNEQYHTICSKKTPITEKLFGDNVEELIKQQSEANKMQGQMRKMRGGISHKVFSGRVGKNYRKNQRFSQHAHSSQGPSPYQQQQRQQQHQPAFLGSQHRGRRPGRAYAPNANSKRRGRYQ